MQGIRADLQQYIGGGQKPHPDTSIREFPLSVFERAPRPSFSRLAPASFGPKVVFTKPRFAKGSSVHCRVHVCADFSSSTSAAGPCRGARCTPPTVGAPAQQHRAGRGGRGRVVRVRSVASSGGLVCPADCVFSDNRRGVGVESAGIRRGLGVDTTWTRRGFDALDIDSTRTSTRRDRRSPRRCNRRSAAGLVLLNVVTALFGCNQALIKTLETDDATAGAMESSVLMALRFSIAAAAMGGLAVGGRLLQGGATSSTTAGSGATAVAQPTSSSWAFVAGATELAMWLFLGFMTQAVGLQHTTASSGALLGSLTVVVVPILSMLDGKRIGTTSWASVGLAVLGIVLFVGPGALEGADWGLGDALELASAFFFAVQMWRCEKVVRGMPESQIADLTCLQLAIVAAFSWLALLAQGISIPGTLEAMASWPADQWAQVAAMGLVTTAFCIWAETAALRKVDASIAALIYASEPIWGALFAYLWRGETLDGTLTVVGAALLFLASAAGALSSGQQDSDAASDPAPDAPPKAPGGQTFWPARPHVEALEAAWVETGRQEAAAGARLPEAAAQAGRSGGGGDLARPLRDPRRGLAVVAACSGRDQD
ncbi:unnamed protein product [Prorocentrum cordatum]|uniref:EamA domain-containing protein n=1 Tax=Prorocentrum cordatum TaxID=2364126 RepID=A0ABN9VEE5_9DINO|nr:unnamed protein product [Polarella glacialis]